MIEGAFYAIKRTNLIRRFIGIQESESAAYFGVCEQLKTIQAPQYTYNFLSEVVRCGASQKKSPRDSTKSYSPRTLTFSDVPQIAAYHKKF